MASRPVKRNTANDGITVSEHPHIEALVNGDGHIMIGHIKPVNNAAVAYDGHQALALLRYQADEPLASILKRLEAAIATVKATGERVDEWN
ncbi:hypothetical protein H0A71_10620 [Alcaligenaceae bacterium]|nr:hypothetical protein [Alcaligenaceae bacterium]